MWLDPSSSLASALQASFFTGLAYKGTPSVGLDSRAASAQQMQTAMVQNQLNQANNASSLAAAQASQLLQGCSVQGGPQDQLATGTYSWTDLDIAGDGSGSPHLTNKDCAMVMSEVPDEATRKLSLLTELYRVLPVGTAGLSISGSVSCGPKNVMQTRDDQASVFQVSGLSVSALYVLFARNASYVTFTSSSAVNQSLQVSEGQAPLSSARVELEVEAALHRVFLNVYEALLCKSAFLFKRSSLCMYAAMRCPCSPF